MEGKRAVLVYDLVERLIISGEGVVAVGVPDVDVPVAFTVNTVYVTVKCTNCNWLKSLILEKDHKDWVKKKVEKEEGNKLGGGSRHRNIGIKNYDMCAKTEGDFHSVYKCDCELYVAVKFDDQKPYLPLISRIDEADEMDNAFLFDVEGGIISALDIEKTIKGANALPEGSNLIVGENGEISLRRGNLLFKNIALRLF